MRRFLTLSFLSLAAMAAAVPTVEAQDRRRGDVLILNVRPRNWLNPGNVVEPGALLSEPAAVAEHARPLRRGCPARSDWRPLHWRAQSDRPRRLRRA
jgi:hypothetical protein